ncbi:MAG: beta-lactamase [Anaerocolumna sp.]|jgi:beta-lactamase class A|nr:beta-lactamase [Anaerocolumna sp.]
MDANLSLEKRIEAELKSYDGCMGIYINDGKGTIIARNENEEFETASTIKMFILTSLFDEVEKGNKSLNDMLVFNKSHRIDGSGILKSMEEGTQLSVKNIATLMIIISDNIATNMLIEYLGLNTINDCIQKLGCTHTKLHNPIDFNKYTKLGTTTPKEYASLFERIVEGTLISAEASRQMLGICKMQHYNSMLTKSFPQYFMDSDNYEEEIIYVASKSGSMNACRNDGGIVSTPYGKYVIVLLNKDFQDGMYYPEHPATVFGAKVSRLIFDQYLTLEGSLK